MTRVLRAFLGLLLLAALLAEAFAQTVPYTPSYRRDSQTAVTFLDVRTDFGALCNDEADDLNAFTAAVERARALGGAFIVVPGICRVSGTIQVNASNVTFMGFGNQVSMLRTTSATAPIVVFGDGTNSYSSNYVDNLGFTASAVRTAGAAVKFSKITQGGFTRGFVTSQFRGIEIADDSAIVGITNSRFVNPVATTGAGIYINGATEAQIRDVTMAGVRASQPYAGVHVVKASGLRLENVDAVYCGNGLALVPSSGSTIEHIFASRNSWDSGYHQGILIDAASGTTVRRAVFTGDWTASNGDHGVITRGAGTIQGIEFIGHRSLTNGAYGAIFSSGTDISVLGGIFSGNSTTASGTYSGIFFDTISGFRAEGVRSGTTAGVSNVQKFGIHVGNVSSDNYILAGNDVRTNVTAGMSLASPISATRIVRENLGYVSANAGTVASPITDGSGDLTVTHGLAQIPTKVFAQIAGATSAYYLSPHAYGATTFKIRVFDATGSAVLSTAIDPVVWRAEQ